MENHQVVVIGAGPGGYRAAFMAADLGMQVTLIDPAANPGGVCLYRGCIPTKSLLHLAKVKEEAMKAGEMGLTFKEPKIDREKIKNWKDGVIAQLTGGLGQLTKGRKINYIRGWATFLDSNTLEVTLGATPPLAKGGAGEGTLEGIGQKARPGLDPGAKGINQEEEKRITIKVVSVIVATGATPVKLPFIKEWTDRIMNAEIALELKSIPKRLLILGGGYIGMESATIYKALGSEVSLVEALPNIMYTMDQELVSIYLKQNKSMFKETWFETKVIDLEETADHVVATLKSVDGEPFKKEFDAVLVSVGMKPNSAGFGLDNVGVEIDERGFIRIDEQCRTSVPNIFAIGDVSGGLLLAHKASYQGRIAAEVIAGQKSAFDARAIPAVVYTSPEIATAGLSELECKEKNISYRTVKFPWAASGRAVAMGATGGLTKLIIEEGTERILGAGIVGANAGDLISEAVLGIEMAARASDMAMTIHPHPTVSETLMEAAEVFYGHPVHVARR